MTAFKQGRGFLSRVRSGLLFISRIISASVFSHVAESAEMVMRKIDNQIIHMENRIMRKISSLLMIWSGGALLTFALFFFMIEYLGWSNAAALFSIGITVLATGLLIKLGEA